MLQLNRHWLVVTLLCSATSVWAQKSTPKNRAAEIERTRSLWDPESLMKDACEGISRHYKLDPKQREYTCKLLGDRVTKFLEKHEKEFWPLLMELTELQLAGKDPDKAEAKRISDRGYHIFMEAKAEILRGQADFRTILNEDQKKIHDRDLKGLNIQFDSIDRRFQSWQRGKVGGRKPLDGVRIGPRGDKIVPDSYADIGPRRTAAENQWDRYVRDFIQQYRLDSTQKATALAILTDLKNQASQYRKSRQKDLADADSYVREAQLAKPFDKRSLEQAQRIRGLLRKPFDDWFVELKSRLEKIPTEQQRADCYRRLPHLRPPEVARQPSTQPAQITAGTPVTPPAKEQAPPAPGGQPLSRSKDPAPKSTGDSTGQ